ncbi:hypothetical protein FJTKL_02172 [Diaporthe vaccinii]|uniref:Uncharacterized protein n=1 Tax=Diaporthe vaccinii TaxID=105482 RepID=A0ABR4DYT8_9PEZI
MLLELVFEGCTNSHLGLSMNVSHLEPIIGNFDIHNVFPKLFVSPFSVLPRSSRLVEIYELFRRFRHSPADVV